MTAPLTPRLTLEPLRWFDIPAVVAIEQQVFEGDSPWTEAMFWSELASGASYLAAWDGAELVGYAGLAMSQDSACLNTIAIRRRYQGRGIGRRLLTAMIAAAGDLPITLEVRTDNAQALALYDSFGFERIGTRRGYYQPSGADAYTMVRIPVGLG